MSGRALASRSNLGYGRAGLALGGLTILIAISISAETADEHDFTAARQQYERAAVHDETARAQYVRSLAQIIDRRVTEYWKTGKHESEGPDLSQIIDTELKNHPVPKDADTKRLAQLMVGEWQSPRHIYIFRRDGKCGMEDGPVNDPWRIQNNELVQGKGISAMHSTILVLDQDYLIYADKGTVFFHERVKNDSTAQRKTERVTNDSTARPKTAEVVNISPDQADFGVPVGDIKVTFSDGRSETVTHGGNCMEPRVSDTGNIGWTHFSGLDRRGYALDEKLVIRLRNGAVKEFRPSSYGIFIESWAFADHGSAVVMRSRGHHGPSAFIRYDVASGKLMAKEDGHSDDDPPPAWASMLTD
jgi:hypothetical protein